MGIFIVAIITLIIVNLLVNGWEVVNEPEVAIKQRLGKYVGTEARAGFHFCFLQGLLTTLVRFKVERVEKTIAIEDVKTPDNIISVVASSYRYSPDPSNAANFILSKMHTGVEESFERAIKTNVRELARRQGEKPETWKELMDSTEMISREVIRKICNGATNEDIDAIYNDRANHKVAPWGVIVHKIDVTRVVSDIKQTEAESDKAAEEPQQQGQVKNMETIILMAAKIKEKFPGQSDDWCFSQARFVQMSIDKGTKGMPQILDPVWASLGNNLMSVLMEFARSRQSSNPKIIYLPTGSNTGKEE
ncbi:MAG: SPFH domain-containing protein [Candidatus Paceibacterota bacterium]|jgi:regulator of protease activity HflC (stomatin/prohibitin superfamily)